MLGATDEVKEGNWVWVSGEPWDYTNWDRGEPNNMDHPENYLEIPSRLAPYPLWNDVDTRGGKHFVCEWDEPASQ